MAHTVIPPPRVTTVTLELTHKGNLNDKTIPESDREVRDFNVTLFASALPKISARPSDARPSDARPAITASRFTGVLLYCAR